MVRAVFPVAVLSVAMLLALAVGAQAQSPPPAEAAEASVARGDLEAALRLVRQGLSDAPGSGTLLELRLRLLQQGVGYARIDVLEPLRRARRAGVARSLLEADPTNAVAHDELGRQALDVARAGLDLVKPTSPRTTLALVMTDEAAAFDQTGLPLRALRARFPDSRFDLDALGAFFPVLDASGPARDALGDAARHLRAALASADGVFGDAIAGHLAQTLVLQDDWRALAALGASRPDGVFWAGLAAFQLGDVDAADAAFARALGQASPETAARYADLAPLLTPDEAAAWAADPAGFAPAYWLRQDPRLATPVNERRVEHLARVAEADLRFAPGGASGARGGVWIRYGPPARRHVVSDVAYDGDSRDGLYDVWEYPTHRLVFRDAERGGDYRLYSPPASAFGDAATAAQADGDDSVSTDEVLRRTTPTRSGIEIAQFDLPALASVLPGSDGEAAEVIVAYGVPLSESPTGAVPLAADVAAFLLVPGTGAPLAERRRRLDVLPASGVVALPSLTLWAGAEQLAARPGASTVTVEVAVGGRVGVSRIELDVPGPTGALALSDLVLAYLVEDADGGPVSRRGIRIVPAPVAAFDRSEPFFVYVEVYGLALADGRTDYTFETALVPSGDRPALRRLWDGLTGRSRSGVATASRAAGDAPTDEQYVALDASGVPPGRYTLVVRVRDAVGGAEVRAQREVLLE